MPIEMIEEGREFHHFLTNKLSAEGINLSPEDAIDKWRRLHPQTQAFGEEVAANLETLDDWTFHSDHFFRY
jgi:hypothetical protein